VASLPPATVLKQIAAGTPDPLYLLQGDDEVEKSAIASAFADLVEPEATQLLLRLQRRSARDDRTWPRS